MNHAVFWLTVSYQEKDNLQLNVTRRCPSNIVDRISSADNYPHDLIQRNYLFVVVDAIFLRIPLVVERMEYLQRIGHPHL